MSRHPPEPLTAEERAVSDVLARDRALPGPSPALDAAILGAARTAAGAPPRGAAAPAPGFRTRRALRTLGLAASVVLAVGVAWQLRPGAAPDLVEFSEAPAVAVMSERAPASPAPPPPPQQDVAATRDAEPTRAAREAPHAVESRAAAAAAAQDPPTPARAPEAAATRNAPAAAAAPAEPPPLADEAADPHRERSDPAQAVPPPPPPPSAARAAAAAPSMAMPDPGPAQRQRDAQRARDLQRAQRSPAPAPAMEAARKAGAAVAAPVAADASTDRDADEVDIVFDEAVFDQPFDDQPPASADSPEVQQAWLTRIGELVEEEQYDAARASLAEFRRRYPDAPLPDGLRRLLE